MHPVVRRALAVEPSGRYQRATALAADLRRAAGGAALTNRPLAWLVVGGGLALFLLAPDHLSSAGSAAIRKILRIGHSRRPSAPQRIAAESSVKDTVTCPDRYGRDAAHRHRLPGRRPSPWAKLPAARPSRPSTASATGRRSCSSLAG